MRLDDVPVKPSIIAFKRAKIAVSLGGLNTSTTAARLIVVTTIVGCPMNAHRLSSTFAVAGLMALVAVGQADAFDRDMSSIFACDRRQAR